MLALLAVLEGASFAESTPSHTWLTVLGRYVGIVAGRTGTDTAIGRPVVIVAQGAHMTLGAISGGNRAADALDCTGLASIGVT